MLRLPLLRLFNVPALNQIKSMIINLTQDGCDVIYHRAPALLAAQLGGHWQRTNAPDLLHETLAAISHHDDLEKEWKGSHLSKSGAP